MEFSGPATPLSEGDIIAEAQILGCEPAAIWAVCDVESNGSGFLPDGRPKILFEAKSFHTLTGGRYDRSYPNISSPTWNRSLYGPSGAHQYDRLASAIELDRTAALESASWGRFQIMGSNYKICGYSDVETFVQDMVASEANHLKAFTAFCRSNKIVNDLITHDWAHFALRYNGPGQVPYYAQRIDEAYQRHLVKNGNGTPTVPSGTLKSGSKGQDVVTLQNDLIKLGYQIASDGDFGPATKAAVIDFQTNKGLTADGIVGPKTSAAIESEIVAKP
jgi:hypothetical protein